MCGCGRAYTVPTFREVPPTVEPLVIVPETIPTDCGYSETELANLNTVLDAVSNCGLVSDATINSYRGILLTVERGHCTTSIDNLINWLETYATQVAECLPDEA